MAQFEHVLGHPAASPTAPRLKLVDDAWAHEFIRLKRARGVCWSAIARMLGRCEHDVRRLWDPDYSALNMVSMRPTSSPEPAGAAAAREPVRHSHQRPARVIAGSMQHRCLRAIGDGLRDRYDIAGVLHRTPGNASDLAGELKRKGFVAGITGTYRLTDAGKAELERLRG